MRVPRSAQQRSGTHNLPWHPSQDVKYMFVGEVFSEMADLLQICTGLTEIFGHGGDDCKEILLLAIGCYWHVALMAGYPHGML